MSERKINLDLILARFFSWDSKTGKVSYCNILDLKWAMKEAIRQALELAAENAELKYYEYYENWMEEYMDISMTKDDLDNVYGIDKQSILNTINQIE